MWCLCCVCVRVGWGENWRDTQAAAAAKTHVHGIANKKYRRRRAQAITHRFTMDGGGAAPKKNRLRSSCTHSDGHTHTQHTRRNTHNMLKAKMRSIVAASPPSSLSTTSSSHRRRVVRPCEAISNNNQRRRRRRVAACRSYCRSRRRRRHNDDGRVVHSQRFGM